MRRIFLSFVICASVLFSTAGHAQQEGDPEAPSPDSAPPAAPAAAPAAAAVPAPPPAPAATPARPPPSPPPAPPEKPHEGRFAFGSYGRVLAATDAAGRPARDTDIVAHGSRVDLDNYVELELRREDHWEASGADTRLVATLAVGHPLFHYDGVFDARIAVRNLYIEEKHLGLRGLGLWIGSRMLRGDDVYLFDYWPLDNLNTLGAGVRYDAPTRTSASVHVGFARPDNPFYRQQAERPAPLNQFGVATIAVLDRQRWIGSARLEQHVGLGGGPAALKGVLYGEAHQVPSGQRETAEAGVFEEVPNDGGFVLGAQLGGYTGARDTHVNLFVRYARDLAAYGDFAAPVELAPDRTASGAHEIVVAVGANVEIGPAAILAGAYLRSFRNASAALDFGDVDEGIVMLRPYLFFVDWAGIAVEGSFQIQERGVLVDRAVLESADGRAPPSGELEPLFARVTRLAVMPFLSPAGLGAFKRPHFAFVYAVSFRDDGARALYPRDDPLRARDIDHYFGFGAEWWFGSTSYGEP